MIRHGGQIVGRLSADSSLGVRLDRLARTRRVRRALDRRIKRARRYFMAGCLPPDLGQGFSMEQET